MNTARDLIKTIQNLTANMNTTVLLATHNVELVAEMGTRVIRLERGRIVFDAKNSNLWLNRLLRELVWAWRLIRSNIAQGAVLAGLIIIATLLEVSPLVPACGFKNPEYSSESASNSGVHR